LLTLLNSRGNWNFLRIQGCKSDQLESLTSKLLMETKKKRKGKRQEIRCIIKQFLQELSSVEKHNTRTKEEGKTLRKTQGITLGKNNR